MAGTMVVLGATGDLARRKLGPALFRLCSKGRLPDELKIVGTASSELDDAGFRQLWKEGIDQFLDKPPELGSWNRFAKRLSYVSIDLTNTASGADLEQAITVQEIGGNSPRLYYLALPPSLFVPAVELLGEVRKHRPSDHDILVVEKPFGSDAASARELTDQIHRVFDERQVFRIDHYLGKETAQNLMYLRFANTIFEPLWNRNQIEEVQITVAETVDVADRAGYYDSSGVLRDMFQNHLMQLLTLIAMEPPVPMTARTVHDEKAKVLSAIRPIQPEDIVVGQYRGYREHEGVAEGSTTPTYAAVCLWIDNWRWQGVPFHLQSGKALANKNSTISLEFKRPPYQTFGQFQSSNPNVLAICIQPDEGVHLALDAKVPDQTDQTARVEMEYHYRDSFPDVELPNAYERLLLDALNGDSTLFARQDEIDLAWKLIDPVIERLKASNELLPVYEPGVRVPDVAVELLASREQRWRAGCREHD